MFKLYKINNFLMPFLVLLFGSCVDKDLSISEDNKSIDNFEGTTLRFSINLSKDRTTRSGSASVDDYIDTENKCQILFFSENGDFLFEALNRKIEESGDIDGEWYVTIPLKDEIVDRNNKKFNLNLIKSQLEKETFKIAVLANWTNDGEPYIVDWGWSESLLNPNVSNKKNINDLHHLEEDTSYGTESRKKVFGFLMDSQGNLGLKTDWVTSTIELNGSKLQSRGDGEIWIRDNWDPGKDYTTDNSLRSCYSSLWQLWNFGACYNDNKIEFSDLNAKKFSNQWKEKNDFTDKLKNDESGETQGKLTKGINYQELTFLPGDDKTINVKDVSFTGKYSYAYSKEGYYGIALGKTNYYETITSNGETTGYRLVTSDNTKGYITFKAPAGGILRVWYSSDTQGKTAQLVVQRKNSCEAVVETTNTAVDLENPYLKQISITQDPEDIYLFNVSDEANAVVYAIEYICDRYLYETDRQAIIPNIENNPIPMYGVQNFNKIETWGTEEILDLSMDGLDINLVRALAKVEVYLPQKAEYVFMRCMNRFARCEPVDVETPTDLGWTRYTSLGVHDAAHCEAFDIQKYGCGYTSGSTNQQDYKNWLSWFYGSWVKKRESSGSNVDKSSTDWKWNWNGTAITLPEEDYYPHIFNPMIVRSDFCEFSYEGETADGHKYVIYMPDKNISDPNNDGLLSETPKVPHIEYRYKDSDNYLDDNQCHRIYFTDYSTNTDIKGLPADKFDSYEKNTDHLNKHWPVMRNHVYRFFVGSDNAMPEILVKVTDWDKTPNPKKEVW